MAVRVETVSQVRTLHCCLRHLYWLASSTSGPLSHIGEPLAIRHFQNFFSNNEARIFIEFEQSPNRDSRVFLTGDKDRLGLRRLGLDWRLSEQDIRTARALGEAIGREAYLRGLGPVPI